MAYEKKVKETETLMREQLQDDEMDEETENELYMARIDSGLFALQTIDYIFAEVVVGCGEIIADRMEQALQVHGSSVANIKRILKEYADNVADDGLLPKLDEHIRSLVSQIP
eukprot:m.230168 g.230168  ORF g.230168 m.230168 type:complete len:112 (-) comp10868_c0_seq5:131-466(-)